MSSDEDLIPFGSILPAPKDPLPSAPSEPPPPAPSDDAPSAVDPLGLPASSSDLATDDPVAAPPVPPPPDALGPDDPSSEGWGSGSVDTPSEPIGQDEAAGSSGVAVLAPPRPHHELGSEWSFGGKDASSVTIPTPRKSLALAVVVVLVAAAGAYFFLNRSKSAEGTALTVILTQGQTYRYHLNMTFNGSVSAQGDELPINMLAEETFAWEVESVDANGVATIQMSVDDINTSINGQPSPEVLPPPIEIRVARDGRILNAGNMLLAGDSDGPLFPGADQITPILPDHPVKPGDSWRKEFDQEFPFGAGTIHFVTNSEYLKDDNVDGVQAAVISSTINLPLDLTIDVDKLMRGLGEHDPSIPAGAKMIFTGSMKFTQIAWLDLAHGLLLKGSIIGRLDMSVEFKDVPDVPGKFSISGNMSIQLSRVSGAAPTPEPTTSHKKKKGT